jgi:hypothetical protein
MTEQESDLLFDSVTGECNISFVSFSARWTNGIWSKWASEQGIKLPPIHPRKLLPGDEYYISILLPKEYKAEMEREFYLTLQEYANENEGKLPFWASQYIKRVEGHPFLTPRRCIKKIGYMIEKDDFPRDKIWEFFHSPAYIEKPGSIGYNQLNKLGTPCVEKELFRSRNKRLLVYRYLNRQGEVTRFVGVRWLQDQIKRNVRVEEYLASEKTWEIRREIITKIDGDFEKDSRNGFLGFSMSDIDKLVFSLP